MTAMGGRATDAATENGWRVFLPDSVLRSVEDEGTHRDRISSTLASSGHAFWYNAGGNFVLSILMTVLSSCFSLDVWLLGR